MLTAPNLLSFARIVAAPVLYALVRLPIQFGFAIALLVFVLASFTDTIDGEVARRRHQVSALGIYLDTTADKILIAVLLIGLVIGDLVPGWMAAIIIAREFLVTGLRSYAAALGVVIPAGRWGKAKTAITIGALILVLLAGDAGHDGLTSGSQAIRGLLLHHLGPLTLPSWALALAVIWTIGSGAEYIRGAMPLLTRGARPAPGIAPPVAAEEP